jgi:integrase
MTKRSREPNGASTIYRGKDGFWHGRVTVGVRDDGRPDRRHVMRKVKADAIKAVRELNGSGAPARCAWSVECGRWGSG